MLISALCRKRRHLPKTQHWQLFALLLVVCSPGLLAQHCTSESESCEKVLPKEDEPDNEEKSEEFSTGMAWRAHGKNNLDLVQQLKANSVVRSARVADAMARVDRSNFVSYNAFQDSPQSIGYGVTISAPHMHAYALETLRNHLKEGMSALDVGSGSGYLTACMAELVGETGRVVGIDHVEQLVESSKKNIAKGNSHLFEPQGRLTLVTGDGRKGWPDGGPYDAIHVGAAAAHVPEALLQQLKKGGRLVVPVGPEHGDQQLEQFDKLEDGKIQRQNLMGVRYVPLTNLDHQMSRGL